MLQGQMQTGEYYQRGMTYGEPVGPVFRVERVSDATYVAHLRATTTLTGWVLTANTKDIPDGWVGPLDEQYVKDQQHRQIMRGGKVVSA